MDSTQLTARTLVHRGAEADLYLTRVGDWNAILKQRVSKKYRQKTLDDQIRRERTSREAAIISEARRAGVRTPTVLSVDPEDCTLSILFIPGILARDGLDKMNSKVRTRLLGEVGRQVGLLHRQGIVHGDLTTSNLIVSQKGDPYLIDFGLSHHSKNAEDRAVDLHLLRRSIATSHSANVGGGFRALVKGYVAALGKEESRIVKRKVAEIARRGRYFAIR